MGFIPQATYFKPAGQPLRALEEVALTVEEVQAIRLKDLGVTGAGRVRRKDAHLAAHVPQSPSVGAPEGGRRTGERQGPAHQRGNFAFPTQAFQCRHDGHVWTVPFEALAAGPPPACPRCQSPGVLAVHPRGNGAGRGWGHWRNQPRGERHSRRYKGGEF